MFLFSTYRPKLFKHLPIYKQVSECLLLKGMLDAVQANDEQLIAPYANFCQPIGPKRWLSLGTKSGLYGGFTAECVHFSGNLKQWAKYCTD